MKAADDVSSHIVGYFCNNHYYSGASFLSRYLNGMMIVPAGCENSSVRYCSVSRPFACAVATIEYRIAFHAAQANGIDAERYLSDLFSQPAGTIILPFDS